MSGARKSARAHRSASHDHRQSARKALFSGIDSLCFIDMLLHKFCCLRHPGNYPRQQYKTRAAVPSHVVCPAAACRKCFTAAWAHGNAAAAKPRQVGLWCKA